MVVKGQRIGTIRPNVGMLELGFNANWGSVWGTNHPAPWVDDPRPLLKALIQDQSPSIAPADGSTGTAGSPGSIFDFASIAPTLKSWGEYAAIFILALLFVMVGIYLLGGHPVQSVQSAATAPINYVQNRRVALKNE